MIEMVAAHTTTGVAIMCSCDEGKIVVDLGYSFIGTRHDGQ